MAKSVVPFNYNEIYQQIAQKFIDKGYDAPYEGSNTGILTSILAYAIQGMNFNTAQNINEVILPLCKKRKSAVQNARILGYEPKARISNQIEIYIKPKRGNVNVIIPQYQEFKINGYSYYYFGEKISHYYDEDLTNYIKIIVKQGTLLKYEDYSDVLVYSLSEEKQYIDIPFSDVENDGLEVTVDTYDEYGNQRLNIPYSKKVFNMQEADEIVTDAYYRKDDLDTGNCRIYFRLGGMGKALKEGSQIRVNVLRTDGSKVNSDSFSCSISGELSAVAEVVQSGEYKPSNYISGADEESIESIQQNAPMFYNTAGRCITEYDYRTFLQMQTSILKPSSGYGAVAWGGEDELIPQVGKIYYCCIPNKEEPIFEKQEVLSQKVVVRETPRVDEDGQPVLDPVTGEQYIDKTYADSFTYNTTSNIEDISTYRKLKYKNNLYLDDGEIVSAIESIKEYGVPGLLDYVKNPTYIFADINVDIKKYEYGVSKGSIHEKIFNTIKSYFENRVGLEANYVESALIKEISEVLGSNNGFTLDTLFSGYIGKENRVQLVTKNFDYNAAIISYLTSVDTKGNLKVQAYLNEKCQPNDKLKFKFNQKCSNGLTEVDEITQAISANDIARGYLEFMVSPLESLDLEVICNENSTNPVKANVIPLSFNKIHYATEVTESLYSLNAVLNPQVKLGDRYEIFLTKDDILNKIGEAQDIKYSDLENGTISYSYMIKDPELKVDDITIRVSYQSTGEDGNLTWEYYESIKHKTLEEAQKQSQSDKTEAYDNQKGKDKFIVTNSKNPTENKYDLTMILPGTFKSGDIITIRYGSNIQRYTLTEKDILNYKVYDPNKATVEIASLDVKDGGVTFIPYDSISGIAMTILKSEEYSANRLIPDADDRIQYSNTESSKNYCDYTKTSVFGNEIKLKDEFTFNFEKNKDNRIDIRNFIVNYGDLETHPELDKIDENVCSLSLEISNSGGANAKYEDGSVYITSMDPSGGSTQIVATLVVGDKVYTAIYNIPVKANSADDSLSEGIGGIYIHLDLPPEGIYDDSGNLVTENLPLLYAIGVSRNRELFNISSLGQDLGRDLSEVYDPLGVVVYVDTNIEDDEIIKGLYPYFINKSVNQQNPHNTYKWLRLPIKMTQDGKEENTTTIGTYIIVNSSKPYIRIKLKNEILNLFSDTEFEVVYPSNNLTISKNTALRLRSVNITCNGENYELRQTLKERKTEIGTNLFGSWAYNTASTYSDESADTPAVV